jgi:hypothetical protein
VPFQSPQDSTAEYFPVVQNKIFWSREILLRTGMWLCSKHPPEIQRLSLFPAYGSAHLASWATKFISAQIWYQVENMKHLVSRMFFLLYSVSQKQVIWPHLSGREARKCSHCAKEEEMIGDQPAWFCLPSCFFCNSKLSSHVELQRIYPWQKNWKQTMEHKSIPDLSLLDVKFVAIECTAPGID